MTDESAKVPDPRVFPRRPEKVDAVVSRVQAEPDYFKRAAERLQRLVSENLADLI